MRKEFYDAERIALVRNFSNNSPRIAASRAGILFVPRVGLTLVRNERKLCGHTRAAYRLSLCKPSCPPLAPSRLRLELAALHRESYVWALHCCRGDAGRAEDALQEAYLKILAGVRGLAEVEFQDVAARAHPLTVRMNGVARAPHRASRRGMGTRLSP